jgi:hypothetical protein
VLWSCAGAWVAYDSKVLVSDHRTRAATDQSAPSRQRSPAGQQQPVVHLRCMPQNGYSRNIETGRSRSQVLILTSELYGPLGEPHAERDPRL